MYGMRAGELSGLFPLSLSLDMFLSESLLPCSTVVPVPLAESWETRRCDASRGPLVCVSNAYVQRCSRSVVDHPRCRPISLLGFVRIEYSSLTSIRSRPRLDPIP